MKESAAITLLLKFGNLKDIFERKLTFIKHNLKYQSTLNKANFNIMRFITTFNVVLSVLGFGYYRIVTITDIFQRSLKVARATYINNYVIRLPESEENILKRKFVQPVPLNWVAIKR